MAVRLDRIGRSLRNLLDVVGQLEQRGVNLEILDQGLRTDTPAGRMIFSIMGALAEYERELIIERTRDGLAATPNRGRRGGRPNRLTDAQIAKAKQLKQQSHGIREIGEMLGKGKPIGRTVLYRALGMVSEDPRRVKEANPE